MVIEARVSASAIRSRLSASSVGLAPAHQIQSTSTRGCGRCGCGAVVAHHLAKVRVASSNLVIRSNGSRPGWLSYAVTWPRGEATACKAVYTGSNPVVTSKQSHPRDGVRHENVRTWAVGAAVARFPDTEEVAGSIPVPPTRITQQQPRIPRDSASQRQAGPLSLSRRRHDRYQQALRRQDRRARCRAAGSPGIARMATTRAP